MPALIRAFLAIALCVLASAAGAQQPVPELTGRVNDVAGALNSVQRIAIEEKLASLEMETGAQIAVLLVPTTRPESIEQYAFRVAESWRLGREGVDDGALLVVATEDRRLRIEVGYGLEGAIPDALANRIIDEAIVPHFRNGDIDGGIAAGVDRLVQLVKGEPLPPPSARPDGDGSLADFPWPAVLIGGIFLGGLLRRALGVVPGARATGGLTGGAAWLGFGGGGGSFGGGGASGSW
ncbi:MAG: YgcG family protein [Gammaproteobacteria bacterium]